MHKLPPLPYGYGDLAPVMSREALELHHLKHHGGHIDRLNSLLERTGAGSASLEQLVRSAHGEVFDNAAQAWNHEFYWRCMSPLGGGTPGAALAEALTASFKSFKRFRQEFEFAGRKFFGSGWIWLVVDATGALRIRVTATRTTPLRSNLRPLLTCDLWEHAYYLDHRSRRADHLAAFWELVNWKFVERAPVPRSGCAARAPRPVPSAE